MENFPPASGRDLSEHYVKELVENMVEHGMRVIQLQAPEMIRWHFSPEGKIKNADLDWLETSADGTVAFDAFRLDELVRQCDETGKPWDLSYMVYINSLLDPGYSAFKKAFPDRFKGQTAREGHWYQDYYAQEMMGLLKKHLEKKGWQNRFVLKISDEPAGFDFWWNRFHAGRARGRHAVHDLFQQHRLERGGEGARLGGGLAAAVYVL